MKRVLIKISGESLSSENNSIDGVKAQDVASLITGIKDTGVEVVVVVGGGNIYRGSGLIAAGVDPSDSHNMSMLSTVFNCVTLKNFLEKLGQDVVVMDALHVEFLEKYSAMTAREYIKQGKIVLCSSGGGTPFFTTDTTGTLRALELHCDAFIKLTKVDGVYDSDPISNPDAKKYDIISYDDFVSQNLKVLDQSAVLMARDNKLPVYITKMDDMQSILNIIAGKKSGTKIS